MLTPKVKLPTIKSNLDLTDQHFLEIIEECLKKKSKETSFGVKDFSNYLSINLKVLNRRLQNLTGYSTGELINYYRLQSAKQILIQGEVQVNEIASLCGFSGHSNFCRSFSAFFNCSPSTYRLQQKNEKLGYGFTWAIPFKETDFNSLLELAYKHPWLAQALIATISNLSNENNTVEQLAASLYFSTSTLNRKIKELFRITPQELIRDLKLQYASELLASKSKSITKIGYEAGFFDHAHFCHCFKIKFGCTPSDFKSDINSDMSLLWLKKN